MKTCRSCGLEQPVEEFRQNRPGSVGRRNQCRSCDRERARAYTAAHPARRFDSHLRSLYGISLEERQRLESLQRGRCAGCDSAVRLDVDHCHESGLVRGLLCPNCNKALGLLKDETETLRRLVAYLEDGVPGW